VDLDKKRDDRSRFPRRPYELTDGHPFKTAKVIQIGSEFGLSHEEANDVAGPEVDQGGSRSAAMWS
jgi:hypothetical protein